jgi:hypothetical protein
MNRACEFSEANASFSRVIPCGHELKTFSFSVTKYENLLTIPAIYIGIKIAACFFILK